MILSLTGRAEGASSYAFEGRASKTPEHSGRFRRKPLRYGLLRRGVSRNLAAPNPPQGVSFCLFFFFFLFSFFFLGGVLPYSRNDLQAHFGQKYRLIGQKYRLHRAKVPSTSGKSIVFISGIH